MFECSVLTWPPAGEVPVTCLRGGYSPSQGGCSEHSWPLGLSWTRLRVWFCECGQIFNDINYLTSVKLAIGLENFKGVFALRCVASDDLLSLQLRSTK